MKKTYQISKKQAVRRFQQQIEQLQPVVQIVLPLTGLSEQMQPGLLHMARQLGITCLERMMAWEAEQLAGPRRKTDTPRQYNRWGTERGYCILAGQKVPLERPRVRDVRQREVRLGSYEMIQQASLQDLAAWDKIMRGLTMRRYSEVIREFADAYGIAKSTVSRHFIEASRGALDKLSSRALRGFALCAILIDGQYFQQQEIVVALGVTTTGQKVVLGLRQGATENAVVVKQLLEELQDRGVRLIKINLLLKNKAEINSDRRN